MSKRSLSKRVSLPLSSVLIPVKRLFLLICRTPKRGVIQDNFQPGLDLRHISLELIGITIPPTRDMDGNRLPPQLCTSLAIYGETSLLAYRTLPPKRVRLSYHQDHNLIRGQDAIAEISLLHWTSLELKLSLSLLASPMATSCTESQCPSSHPPHYLQKRGPSVKSMSRAREMRR